MATFWATGDLCDRTSGRSEDTAAKQWLRDCLPGIDIRSAAELGGAGGYDLVTIFEAVHDMSRPVDALRAVGHALRGRDTARGRRAGRRGVHAPRLTTERTEYG